MYVQLCVFFVKQKTAYEMRISDWSSDVCSSDLLTLGVLTQVSIPAPTTAEIQEQGRPLSAIVRQPVFFVAAISGMFGYGVMNLMMTATPLAMQICQHPFAAAATVIQWHVFGMFFPSFFTGTLIARFGVLRIIIAGAEIG